MADVRRVNRAGLEGHRHGRVPRDVRRRQLLGLGEALFAERGYTGASMDELARRAGVSKPVIYELVGNKEELFRACMLRASDDLAVRVTAAVQGANGARERLMAGTLAWFSFVAEHRDIWDGLLSGMDSPLTSEVTAIRQRQARVVADLLAKDAEETGVVAPPEFFDALAHLINGANESLAAWWRDHSEVPPSLLAELCTRVFYFGLESMTVRNVEWPTRPRRTTPPDNADHPGGQL